jgi:gamma-glutamylcyclotransferase (GGCT)/AIG2-like uncharacterized protein YtfP
MPDLVFFYGTLMMPFKRTARARIDRDLELRGRGTISAALFDLGIYPAAVPTPDARVYGELYAMRRPSVVLTALDELEGYRPDDPATSLYTRELVPVRLDDGGISDAWVYFYNAPLGRAERIASGDYLEYLKVR